MTHYLLPLWFDSRENVCYYNFTGSSIVLFVIFPDTP
jgi:hypothetical protein